MFKKLRSQKIRAIKYAVLVRILVALISAQHPHCHPASLLPNPTRPDPTRPNPSSRRARFSGKRSYRQKTQHLYRYQRCWPELEPWRPSVALGRNGSRPTSRWRLRPLSGRGAARGRAGRSRKGYGGRRPKLQPGEIWCGAVGCDAVLLVSACGRQWTVNACSVVGLWRWWGSGWRRWCGFVVGVVVVVVVV